MRQQLETRKWLLILVLVVVLTAAGAGYFIYSLSSQIQDLEQQQQTDRLEQQAVNQQLIESLRQQSEVFGEAIGDVRSDIDLLAQIMENNTAILASNIQVLDNNIRYLDEQLSGVATGFNALSLQVSAYESQSQQELDALRSEVQSLDQDFSFITNLYPAIVSVQTDTSQGSGFFVRSDGYIATNAHVVEGANQVQVVLSNGQAVAASIVGTDEDYDIAVLRVSGSGFMALGFAERSSLAPAQRIVTIGNPLGLSFSLTQGVISALDRRFEGSPVSWIQTDTPINPGNSGGPLINTNGRVVGVATAIIQESNSIGFAVPSYQAEQIISDLIS